MTKSQTTEESREPLEADEPAGWDVPKMRHCLRCRAEFSSAWSGERICSRCKGSHDWRTGASHMFDASASGR